MPTTAWLWNEILVTGINSLHQRSRHRATAPREEEEKPVSKVQEKAKEDLDVNAVFAKLKQIGGKAEDKNGN